MSASSHYWVGYLATTVAIAGRDPEPQPLLKVAMREFLKDHPAGTPLGDNVRDTLKQKEGAA